MVLGGIRWDAPGGLDPTDHAMGTNDSAQCLPQSSIVLLLIHFLG